MQTSSSEYGRQRSFFCEIGRSATGNALDQPGLGLIASCLSEVVPSNGMADA